MACRTSELMKKKKKTNAIQILFVINQPDVYKSPSSNTWM
jgi:hypothetical protein